MRLSESPTWPQNCQIQSQQNVEALQLNRFQQVKRRNGRVEIDLMDSDCIVIHGLISGRQEGVVLSVPQRASQSGL